MIMRTAVPGASKTGEYSLMEKRAKIWNYTFYYYYYFISEMGQCK